MSSDLVVMSLTGVLCLALLGVFILKHRFRHNLDTQAQAKALVRHADQLLGLARHSAPYLESGQVIEVLLHMAHDQLDQAFHLCPNDPAVNRCIAALHDFEAIWPQQLCSAELPIRDEDRLAALNLQFTEIQRAIHRAKRQQLLPKDEADPLSRELEWRLMTLGVECHCGLASASLEQNDKTNAHHHYRQALQRLRKFPEASDRMRDIRLAMDKLEASAIPGSLNGRANQGD